MKYEIIGTPFPAVVCTLEQGQKMKCQSGAMSWMSANMKMETTSGGGIGKVFSRALSGDSLFQNVYYSENGQGLISFSSSFPGNIIAVQISPGNEIICQKTAFLAATEGVDLSIFFQKKVGAGLFGGEGFIMQKLSGTGIAFLELDGSTIEYQLQENQQMILDTGHLAMMSSTCSIDIKSVGGIKNTILGGEGIFNTVVTGPGKIVLQTMPANKFVDTIIPFIPTQTGGNTRFPS